MRTWAGACEEVTREPDDQSPGDRLLYLVREEFPGLALVLQSRPEDLEALGRRLAEIEEEKDKEVAELKAAVEDAEAINYTLAVGCKRMQSLLHPTSKIVADGFVLSLGDLQRLSMLLNSARALSISGAQWASSEAVAAAMAGLGYAATLDAALDCTLRLVDLSAADGRVVAGMEPLASLLMTTVMDQLPAHQAILSNCFYIDLAPHEDPLELQTQASKITGALATLFSAIGRAYMGEIAAGGPLAVPALQCVLAAALHPHHATSQESCDAWTTLAHSLLSAYTLEGRHAWGAMVAAYGPYLAPHVNLLATQRTYSGSFQTLSPAAQKEFQAQRSRLLTPLAALARVLLLYHALQLEAACSAPGGMMLDPAPAQAALDALLAITDSYLPPGDAHVMRLFQDLPNVAQVPALQEPACCAIAAYTPWLVQTAQQLPEAEAMVLLQQLLMTLETIRGSWDAELASKAPVVAADLLHHLALQGVIPSDTGVLKGPPVSPAYTIHADASTHSLPPMEPPAAPSRPQPSVRTRQPAADSSRPTDQAVLYRTCNVEPVSLPEELPREADVSPEDIMCAGEAILATLLAEDPGQAYPAPAVAVNALASCAAPQSSASSAMQPAQASSTTEEAQLDEQADSTTAAAVDTVSLLRELPRYIDITMEDILCPAGQATLPLLFAEAPPRTHPTPAVGIFQELQGQDGSGQPAVSEEQGIQTIAGAAVCVSVAAADTCVSVAGRMAGLGDVPAQRFRSTLRLGYWLAGAGAGVAAAGLALFKSSP